MNEHTAPAVPTESRISRLRRKMSESGLDAFLVLIEANRRYLSGYTGEDGQFDETAGALLISSDQCLLATDSRYALQAREETRGFAIECYQSSLYAALPGLFTHMGVGRVGFESARLSVKHHQELMESLRQTGLTVTLVPTESMVESLRAVKDADELARTRKAVLCAEAAYRQLIAWLRPGLSEAVVARKLEDLMIAAGAEGASFPIIVAAGPNSAKPHAVPGSRPLAAGEPILFDWGARVEGYCSDISRTVVLGPPSETFTNLYAIVRKAQSAAIGAIRHGVHGRDVDSVARGVIAAAGFKENFGHGLGHGTGLAIHETPRLSPHSQDSLAAGMIVTVEPGVYLPEWGGIRLENQVMVTENGAENLNALDLDAYILPMD